MRIEVKTADDSDFKTVVNGSRSIALVDLGSFLRTFASDDREYLTKVLHWADRGVSDVLHIKLWDDTSDVWRIER